MVDVILFVMIIATWMIFINGIARLEKRIINLEAPNPTKAEGKK